LAQNLELIAFQKPLILDNKIYKAMWPIKKLKMAINVTRTLINETEGILWPDIELTEQQKILSVKSLLL
ncbi:MAG: hypothetical protein RR069_00815, partial [Oscillospiraceae bacterium]